MLFKEKSGNLADQCVHVLQRKKGLTTIFILFCLDFLAGLPDFSRHNIPKRGEIYQTAAKLPNGHEMYQMAVIYSKLP
jgi:hypothetical protein